MYGKYNIIDGTDEAESVVKARSQRCLQADEECLEIRSNDTKCKKIRIFNTKAKGLLLYGCETWKFARQIINRRSFIRHHLRKILKSIDLIPVEMKIYEEQSNSTSKSKKLKVQNMEVD